MLANAGEFGFTCHRIPALTVAANGDILASWDGRPGGCGDSPNPNSILQRRSTDGGTTWGPVTVIAAGKTSAPIEGYSDPSYVVDRETGDIFAFFVKSFDQGFFGSVAGTDPANRQVAHAAVVKSTDDGLTWSEPRVITADITPVGPNGEDLFKSRFAASGEGIQLRYGEHAGRLVQQFTFRTLSGNHQAVSVFSDDHGATWEPGTPFGVGMDENKVVELSDGRLMVNSRSSAGIKARLVAISSDGGVTYSEPTVNSALPDPNNNAGLTRAFPDAPQGSAEAKILLFSNAANTGGRSNGTVRVSYDDGQTWSASRVFEAGSMSYSTLTPLTEPGTYGLFFEGQNNQMRYMPISLEWIDPLGVSINPVASTLHRGENTVEFTVRNHGDEAVTVNPAVSGPSWVTAAALTPVTLDAGGEATVSTTLDVSGIADPGTVTLTFSLSAGETTVESQSSYTIALRAGQNASAPIAGTAPVNPVPAQPGEELAKAFDGNTGTIWHTPYDTTVTMPLDVDIELGAEPVDAAWFQYVPRQVGSNGTIKDYELWAGDSLDALTKVEEGTLAANSATKAIALEAPSRFVRLRVLSSYGDTANKWVSAAEFRVTQPVADALVPEVEVELMSEHTAQAGFPASSMFDGDTGTYFHSPYNAVATFPYAIDLSLGDQPVELGRLTMTPQQGASGDGANNGRPGPYRILAGDSLESLTEIASGTWADDAAAKSVPLAGQARFVRLELGATYGSPAATFVAIAELEVFGEEVVEEPAMIGLVLERTDANGSPVEVGDRLSFTVTYTNLTDNALTVFPRTSNLSGVLPPMAPNCRYGGLGSGVSHPCSSGFHVVTQADLDSGSFTPEIVFDATSDRDGLQVLRPGWWPPCRRSPLPARPPSPR